MTVLCSTCGEALADDDYRCPTCGALAPPAETDETAFPSSVFDTQVVDDEGDRHEPDTAAMAPVPWDIPIRDGRPAATRDPLRPVVMVVVAIAALAGLVLLGAQALDDAGSDETASPTETDVLGDEVVRGETTAPSAASPDSEAPATSTTTTEASTTTSTTASTTTSTTSTSTTTSPPTTAYNGSAPRLSSSFGGGWVAQLTSVPASASSADIDAAWSRAHGYAQGAVLARSDDWTSLRPGYWVVLDAGPFSSADDVRAFCARVGHADSSDCLPRELTGRR